jgi:O-antigen biosynthesis protein
MTVSSGAEAALAWTGERYIPLVPGEIEVEHLHRYAFARDLLAHKDVLDIACGEGYGSHLLADSAKSVVGVDLSEAAVKHARSRYVAPNLQFRQGDCARIPLGDCSVDAVVSFETIEHHDQHESMLAEIRRVLRPDGVLIISTPERGLLAQLSQERNEFHVKELNFQEFAGLLARHFKHSLFFGQRVRCGSLMTPMNISPQGEGFAFYAGNSESVARQLFAPEPLFLIALASQSSLPLPKVSFFDGTGSLYQERALQLARVTEQRDAMAAEIDRVKATASWRITRPLRLLAFIFNYITGPIHKRRQEGISLDD